MCIDAGGPVTCPDEEATQLHHSRQGRADTLRCSVRVLSALFAEQVAV
jgi:hypothetical protein